MLAAAIGGENVTTTIEGRQRYPVSVRYPRDLRDDPDRLARILVPVASGAQVPLGQLVDFKVSHGPAMIRNENGFLAGYVFVDVAGRDIGSFVDEAKAAVRRDVALPPGTTLLWSGQYENMIRVRERLQWIVPATIVLIFLLLYANTKSGFKAGLVLATVPFSAVGAIWLFHLLGYNVSIAAWVGMIALLGLDAETAVFMLLFLDLSWDDAEEARPAAQRARDRRGDHPRRGQARAAEDDDRRGGVHGPAADPVLDLGRRRRHEADRRADDRRSRDLVPHGAADLPGGLQALEGARRAARAAGAFRALARVGQLRRVKSKGFQ